MRPQALVGELSPDLLDDDDALNDAVVAFLAAHEDSVGSTRWLAALEFDVVRRQLDSHGREVLDHALGILERAHEEASFALARRILEDARREHDPLLDSQVVGDPQRLGEALELVVGEDAEVRRLGKLVRLAEGRVRRHVADSTWARMLVWEETLIARATTAQVAIARWAFAAGHRAAAAGGTPEARGAQDRVLRRRVPGEAM